MCGSMVGYTSNLRPLRLGEEEKKEERLEYGPMPNVMVALSLFNAAKFR